MLTSISPLGERARGNRYAVTTAAHIAGAVLGGAVVGGAAGAVGWLLLRPVPDGSRWVAGLVVVALACVVALLVDRHGVPTLHRQVDERWLARYRGWVYGAGYGAQLGFGLVTIVPSALVYASVVAAAATGAPLAGATVGAAFGAGRGTAVLAGARVRSAGDLARLHRGVVAAGPRAARAVATAAAVLGGACVVVAIGGVLV